MSIWGELITQIGEDNDRSPHFQHRISTTPATVVTENEKAYQVDWSEHFVEQLTTKLCCPVILSAKAHNNLQCLHCKRNVSHFPGEKRLTCESCKDKMNINRCKLTSNFEITLLWKKKMKQNNML